MRKKREERMSMREMRRMNLKRRVSSKAKMEVRKITRIKIGVESVQNRSLNLAKPLTA